MPSSTAWISCSRETCFSALSWRSAPTKSRLTLPPRCARWADKKKRGGHPRHGAAVQLDRKYSPGGVDDQSRGGRPKAGRRGRSARDEGPSRQARGRIAPVHIVLEDVDELLHEPLAAERPVEPAVDEHGRHRVLERARQ